MKITRRAARRIELIVATRHAEKKAAKPQLNYDNLFTDVFHAIHSHV